MPTRTSDDKISLVDTTTKEHIKDTDTENYVNSFFANVGATLAETFKTEWKDNILTNSENLLDEMYVDENVILSIIRDIDTSKSSSIISGGAQWPRALRCWHHSLGLG